MNSVNTVSAIDRIAKAGLNRIVVESTMTAGPFIFFASMMVVQFAVVLLAFPETKGFTLEELQLRLETK